MLTSVLSGKNKCCIKVRQHFHNDTFKDYVSIKEASRRTLISSSCIENASRGIQKTAGKCKCGKRYTWIRI